MIHFRAEIFGLSLLCLLFMADICFAGPRRIVSLNVCSDQLLMLLAKPENIASISYFSTDPRVSAMTRQADSFHRNQGGAEEILMLKPDLVIASSFSAQTTLFMLKRLGLPVLELPYAQHLTDIENNIMSVADAIGEHARGEAMLENFRSRLADYRQQQTLPKPLTVFYRESSYTTGSGTLAHEILDAAGYINLASKLGMTGSAYIALENLISHPVDMLLSGEIWSHEASMAAAVFSHPAFKSYSATLSQVAINDAQWVCGTPFVLDAIEALVQHRLVWQEQQQAIEAAL